MDTRETLISALSSLRGNRLRTVLTAMGIIIGVAAVIMLTALGTGVQTQFTSQFGRMANQITITKADGTVPGGAEARDLTNSDVTALRNTPQAPDIASVTPSTSGSVVLRQGQAQERSSVVGATGNYLDLSDRTVAVGSWFTDAQASGDAKVAVLGQQAVGLLWGAGTDPAQVVGQSIRINSTTFTVAGVLAQDGQNDNVAIVPLDASRDFLLGNKNVVNQITVKATSPATLSKAMNEASSILDRQHYVKNPADRDFNVHNMQNLLNRSNQTMTYLNLFTVAVGAISLTVGGLGVANIMLVAVTERTREIGIRKAIGARRLAILKQFLTEAMLLSGLGGLVGVIVGVAGALAAHYYLPELTAKIPAPVVTSTPALVAFGISLLIGLVAGVYPAARASRLRPIMALRFE